MKKFIAMFAIRSESFDAAIEVARAACARTDLTVMEADDRDDIKTLVESFVLPGAQPEVRNMAWSTDVECNGWIVRVEWCQRSELGAVSFLRKSGADLKTEACMVLPANRMAELLTGIGVFPFDLIKRAAEAGEAGGDSGRLV